MKPGVSDGCFYMQALHNSSPNRSPTKSRPGEGADYDVQSTYFPAQSTGYVPPHPSSSDPFPQDSPFAGTSMGMGSNSVPSASGQHQPEVVPAVVPSHSAPHAGPASGDTVLHFQGTPISSAAMHWGISEAVHHFVWFKPSVNMRPFKCLNRSLCMKVWGNGNHTHECV